MTVFSNVLIFLEIKIEDKSSLNNFKMEFGTAGEMC